jgi:hypothetical protein
LAAEKRHDIRPMLIAKDAPQVHARPALTRWPGQPPARLILDAFRPHFGEQLERRAAQQVPPADADTLTAADDDEPIDLDTRRPLAAGPRNTRDRLADSIEFPAELASSWERENEFRQTFGPRKLLAYHCDPAPAARSRRNFAPEVCGSSTSSSSGTASLARLHT